MYLDFADDIALLVDSWQVMVALFMKMEEVTQRFGINISARKCEVLYIGRDERSKRVQDISLRGQALKQVEEFTYLGSVITSDVKFVHDTERRRLEQRELWGCCDGDYGV